MFMEYKIITSCVLGLKQIISLAINVFDSHALYMIINYIVFKATLQATAAMLGANITACNRKDNWFKTLRNGINK